MPNDFAAIGSALYARLGTVQYTYRAAGTAYTTGTLGCYDTLAPQGGTPPYVIFQYQAGVDDYVFGGGSGKSLDYLVKVVSNRYYPGMQAFDIYAGVYAALQDAPLSVTGSNLLRCRELRPVQLRDSDGFWHVGAIWRIDFWHS